MHAETLKKISFSEENRILFINIKKPTNMSKIRFMATALLTLLTMVSVQKLHAQKSPDAIEFHSDYPFPFIENICFDENFKERIRVTTSIDVTTLDVLEKLKFRTKTLNKRQREYRKTTGYPVRETTIRSWSKIFPKWYTVADRFKVDETGSYSYFITHNRLIPGGWVGSTDYIPEVGTYGTSETGKGERYYHVPFSSLQFEGYTEHTETVEKVGLLYKYRWTYPSVQMRTEMMRQGFTVTVNTRYIRAERHDVVITYYLDKAVIVMEYYEQQKLVRKVTSIFKYFEQLEQYLIWKTEEIEYETFGNGTCYEVVMETIYENFGFECIEDKDEDVTFRNSAVVNSEFSVFPNPASDLINITLPSFKGRSYISVANSSGQQLNDMFVTGNETAVQMDISMLPSGIYFVHVTQDEQTYVKKFVKP